jgi:transposase-like protein
MNPEKLFCPNINCPSRGQTGKGNIVIHSRQEKRCLCQECEETFAVTKGTIFYRLRTDPKIVMCVIVLLAYGCPVQAIVKAFGFDERTIKNWWQRAGEHCEGLHHHLIGQNPLDLGHVQADEIKAKVRGGYLWIGMSMMVSTRLWLGGAISPKRDKALIQTIANQIRAIALCRPLLLAVDGLPGYVKAFQRAFRSKLSLGKQGRPKLVAWPDINIVQVIKRRVDKELTIEKRLVQGCMTQVQALINRSQGKEGVINTAFIERLNATYRLRLPWLTRRTFTLAHQPQTLAAGLFVVGCFYNLCDPHHSLRLKLLVGSFGHRWVKRTPALAAKITDHIWTVDELLNFKVPPARWSPPKRRGRPTQEVLQLIEKWC